jgi:uncharacterized protein (TIGR02246 family)
LARSLRQIGGATADGQPEGVFMVARSPEEWGPLFQQAMRAGDVEQVLDLYEPEAAFSNRAGQVCVGHAELRQELAPVAAVKTDFTFDLKQIVQTGAIALLHNQYRVTSPQAASGYAIEVLRQQPDGRWLLAIGDPFTVMRVLG